MKFDLVEVPDSLIVVDVGADHTDLLVVEGNRFWIRNLPLAGNDLTRALTDKFQVPFEEAERLKRTAGKSQQVKKIFATMEPVLKDFVGEIHRSIGYYKAQSKQANFKEMILLGDASKLVGLKNYLTQELQIKVSRITRLNRLNLDEGVDVDVLRKHVGGFCTALGLAIQGIGAGRNDVNMVPREVQEERAVAAKKPFYLLAVGILAALLFILAMAKGHRLDELDRILKHKEMVKNIQGYAGAMKNLPDTIELEAELGALEMIGGDRLMPTKVIDAINRALPPGMAEMPKAGENRLPDQVAREANMQKVWLLDVNLERRFDSTESKEFFVLRVSGAVMASDTEQESLSRVNLLFLDRLAQELEIDPTDTRAVPRGWIDHPRTAPLKFITATQKIKKSKSRSTFHHAPYFFFSREITLGDVPEGDDQG
ncbi:MAG: pilus assembly protein PilM [Planctomycetota bacterium]|nr:pilus assembly protein PilM [Planctomycetota bacterium]